MDDSRHVREGQSTTDLSGPVKGLPQRNPALGAQHLFQGTADNQFHDQVWGVPVRTVVVNGNDVRAVQPRRGARLPSKTAEQLRAFLRVAALRRREDLEGDFPAQVLIPGPPDLPHSTRAQPLQEPIPPTHQPSPHGVPRPRVRKVRSVKGKCHP